MVLGWISDLFRIHPEHAVLIVADFLLLGAILLLLAVNYRKLRTRMTLLFLLFVLLVVAATFLDLAEHFVPLHPYRMVPMTAALVLLLYLLRK